MKSPITSIWMEFGKFTREGSKPATSISITLNPKRITMNLKLSKTIKQYQVSQSIILMLNVLVFI